MADQGRQDVDKTELININRQWLEQKYRELKEREQKIKQLAEECKMIRLEMDPMEKWLIQVQGQGIVDELRVSQAETVTAPAEESEAWDETQNDSENLIELRGNALRDEVVSILQQVYPQMMYYREIQQMLEAKGYQVSGKNPGLNLIAHISTDKRIVRGEKRGIYGLSDNFALKLGLAEGED